MGTSPGKGFWCGLGERISERQCVIVRKGGPWCCSCVVFFASTKRRLFMTDVYMAQVAVAIKTSRIETGITSTFETTCRQQRRRHTRTRICTALQQRLKAFFGCKLRWSWAYKSRCLACWATLMHIFSFSTYG